MLRGVFDLVFFIDNCGDGGCDVVEEPTGCSSVDGCHSNPSVSICDGNGCSDDCDGRPCDETSAGSGRCLNGGSKLSDGRCVCTDGFYGSQCEYKVRNFPDPVVEGIVVYILIYKLCLLLFYNISC